MNNWKNLLATINKEITGDKDSPLLNNLGNPADLLFKPATIQEIEIEEKRLGIELPLSYKQFLQESNGLKILNHTYWNILPVQKIQWLRDQDPELIEIWNNGISISDEEYFIYGEDQNAAYVRGEYFEKCIVVSEWGDSAILLLNSAVRFDDEWEAWAFANWHPGAARYKSFWDLVNEEFKSYLELKEM